MAFPTTDADTIPWLSNVRQKVATAANTFGWTPAQVESVQSDCDYGIHLLSHQLPAFKRAQQAASAYKKTMLAGPTGTPAVPAPQAPTWPTAPSVVPPPGIMPRLRAFLRAMTLHPSFTPAVAQEFGIAGTETPAPELSRPKCKAKALSGSQVEIVWTKGDSDGVVIELHRVNADGTEGPWVALGTDRYSPYIDTTPPHVPGRSERREYRLRYLEGDDPVGEWSDVLTVNTTP